MTRHHPPTGPEPSVPVWDKFVRIFHWSLVLCIFTAMVTGFLMGPEMVPVHVYAATSATVLVFLRILWGFFGPSYARFRSFTFSPRTILRHALAVRSGTAKRYLGHNPLGGAMILALIAAIALLGVTGAVVLGGVLKTGPLAAFASYATGDAAKEVHESIALFLLFLVIGHLAGVIFESRHANDPLVPAMVTGQKPARDGDVTSPSVRVYRGTMLVVSALALTIAVVGMTAMASKEPANMPVADISPLVADECTACHMFYHPSLMPAKSWDALTATLDDHFGEDASLDEDTTAEIRDWLMAHAAETADTQPAHIFTRALADGEFTLSETRFWQRMHHEFSEADFSAAPVYTKSNCAACHKDATTGMFSPFKIKE